MKGQTTHPSGWTLMTDEQVQSFVNGYWIPEHVVETKEGIWFVDPNKRRIPPQLTVVKNDE